MARRLVVLLILGAALVATPALADYGQQKQQVDEQLAAVQAKLARTRAHAQQLSAQIGGLTTQIQGLEAKVGDVSTRLAALQADLRLREQRLSTQSRLAGARAQKSDALVATKAQQAGEIKES